MQTINYKAAIYVRLSKDDRDKAESNSITNQKELIKDYLMSFPEIQVCSERVDDGFSGVDFLRPDFELMLDDIKAGLINCVVVKDFSRFGRNYIEVGKYLENIFPFLGVRFISVNDGYDSIKKRTDADDLIVPFKNLMNDAYSRDISVKIRSQLAVKRKKGEFIGNFVTYGYVKSVENKNKILVDEYAAEIVRDIFKWKLEGLSGGSIAKRLDSRGELSPMEYKRYCGLNFTTSFKVNTKSKWTPKAVGRILSNPIYIGVLEQGKRTTPNHKLKNEILKPLEDWAVVKDNHEPIINRQVFEIVQELLLSDTRIAPEKSNVYTLSGKLFCADCSNTMVRKNVPSSCKKYTYYVCSTKKNGKGCTMHSTSENELIDVILTSIKSQISNILELEDILNHIDTLKFKEKESKKLNASLAIQAQEIERYKSFKLTVYEDYKDRLLEKDEYKEFTQLYSTKLIEATKAATRLESEINSIMNGEHKSQGWIDEFKKHKNIKELSRSVVVSLIKKIAVHEDGLIDIIFMYRDKYQDTLRVLSMLERQVN